MTIGTKVTLNDVAKRLDKDGKIDVIAEMMTRRNEILEDMPWIEGNLPTGHKTTVRTGLPDVAWRKLNYGVPNSKSTTMQVTDTCGMLEAYAEVDKALAELNGNTAAFRMSEDQAFIESMNQSMASTLFYGDTTVNPERFLGLSPRFVASSSDMSNIGYNIIKGAGAGATNTSIWLLCWGENTVHGIYPKNSKAGLFHEDLEQQTLHDANGNKYEGYRTHYKWDCGLTVRDWRYVVRVANIDVATLTKNASAGDDLLDLMAQALERVQDLKMGTPVFYVNRTIKSFLRRQIVNKVANATLGMGDVAGKPVMMFGEVPVKSSDAILSTETAIS